MCLWHSQEKHKLKYVSKYCKNNLWLQPGVWFFSWSEICSARNKPFQKTNKKSAEKSHSLKYRN